MTANGVLVVLRGNSGSGKSTVAKLVQHRFPRGRCAVVAQDKIRRELLRERDVAGSFNIELIELIATECLRRELVVLIEGILNADRYQRMLARVAATARAAHFFAWDLDFEETLRRHDQRPMRAEVTPADMASWYHGWQPLNFVNETKLNRSSSADQTAELILATIRSTEEA